jgi:hypothetical protein
VPQPRKSTASQSSRRPPHPVGSDPSKDDVSTRRPIMGDGNSSVGVGEYEQSRLHLKSSRQRGPTLERKGDNLSTKDVQISKSKMHEILGLLRAI